MIATTSHGWTSNTFPTIEPFQASPGVARRYTRCLRSRRSIPPGQFSAMRRILAEAPGTGPSALRWMEPGNILVTGGTASANFPVRAAVQPSLRPWCRQFQGRCIPSEDRRTIVGALRRHGHERPHGRADGRRGVQLGSRTGRVHHARWCALSSGLGRDRSRPSVGDGRRSRAAAVRRRTIRSPADLPCDLSSSSLALVLGTCLRTKRWGCSAARSTPILRGHPSLKDRTVRGDVADLRKPAVPIHSSGAFR